MQWSKYDKYAFNRIKTILTLSTSSLIGSMSLSPVTEAEAEAEGARLENIIVSHVSPSIRIGSEYIPYRSKKRVVRAVCRQSKILGLEPVQLLLDAECIVKEGRMYLVDCGAFEYKGGKWISHYVWESCMVVSGTTRIVVSALEYNAPFDVLDTLKILRVALSHTPIMSREQLVDYVMRTTSFGFVCGFAVGSKYAVAIRDGTGFRCVDRRCNNYFTTYTQWASHYDTVCVAARPFVSFEYTNTIRTGTHLLPFFVKRPSAHYVTGTWSDSHPKTRKRIKTAIDKLYDERHQNGYCICTTNCSCANKVWNAEYSYTPFFPLLQTIGELCFIGRMS